MTESPAEIVAQLLINLGLGTSVPDNGAWPVFVHALPPDKDDALCVYDTAGVLHGRLMKTGETREHKGVQIRVRSLLYRTGYRKIQDIEEAIDDTLNAQVVVEDGSYVIETINKTSTATYIGREETRDREAFTVNATVAITQNP